MQNLPWVKQSSLLKWRCLTLEDLETYRCRWDEGIQGVLMTRSHGAGVAFRNYGYGAGRDLIPICIHLVGMASFSKVKGIAVP
jgi:hypothetical protein